jgi:hypothetical protein
MSELEPGAEAGTHEDKLWVCRDCASGFVYPVEWRQEDPSHWRIVLWCPDCETAREDVFPREQVERLDEELDHSVGVILSDLKRLTHANMSEEIDFFTRVLEAGIVTADDFAPRPVVPPPRLERRSAP